MYNIIYLKTSNQRNAGDFNKHPLNITYTKFPIKEKKTVHLANQHLINLEKDKYNQFIKEIIVSKQNLIHANKLLENYKNELIIASKIKTEYNKLIKVHNAMQERAIYITSEGNPELIKNEETINNISKTNDIITDTNSIINNVINEDTVNVNVNDTSFNSNNITLTEDIKKSDEPSTHTYIVDAINGLILSKLIDECVDDSVLNNITEKIISKLFQNV